jgi:hypothetical protein
MPIHPQNTSPNITPFQGVGFGSFTGLRPMLGYIALSGLNAINHHDEIKLWDSRS